MDLNRIKQYLKNSGWIKGNPNIEFLGAGEYNENYLIVSDNDKFVFRINHGSQLGLENQIEYEFNVLKFVEASGVTPKPFYYDPAPAGINGGVLLMKFLPGRHLIYPDDWKSAAEIFSKIHSLPLSSGLVVQKNPISDIADECYQLLHKFSDHPRENEKEMLLKYYSRIESLGKKMGPSFRKEEFCIVNTEVNSHNFLISDAKSYLVDWEKAVISYRYQDLGHFLVPTTTMWKSDYLYSTEEKKKFLHYYYDLLDLEISFDEVCEKTDLLEQTILLRGLSWCFMAYYEYTKTERKLQNMDTFKKIEYYLNNIEWFLQDKN